ncbi:MAG: asparagine synthase, partial [Bacteroidota bacterium]
LKRLSQRLQHRGPDGEGFLIIDNQNKITPCSGQQTPKSVVTNSLLPQQPKKKLQECGENFRLGLLHRWLKIIDTNNSAFQPLCYEAQKFWLVFNGQIYNYQALRTELQGLGFAFATNTDTEVLLAAYRAWGTAMLSRLDGMWAFALYDSEKQQLFCARDRTGVKPFYYYKNDDIWAFSSEKKAFFELPNFKTSLNESAVFDYLVVGYTELETESLFKGIIELPAAHFLTFDLRNNDYTVARYYDFSYQKNYTFFDKRQFKEAVETVENLLVDAVTLRTNAAVPIGICLSGGIDSSAIAGIAHHENLLKFPLFTASMTGSRFDETAWAAKVAQKVGSPWHQVSPTAEGLLSNLETLVYVNDEPVLGAAAYNHFSLMHLAKQQNCTVLLDGQGADELFGGYPPHYAIGTFEALFHADFAAWHGNITSKAHSSFANKRDAFLLPLKLIAANGLDYFYKKAYKKSNAEYRLMRPDFWQNNLNRLDLLRNERPLQLNTLLHQQYTGGMLKLLLRTSDRNSMWHSIEMRTPFADSHKLAEYVMQLPASYKIRNGISKHLLREAAQSYLPDAIYNRTDKIGFAPPEQEWLIALLPEIEPYLRKSLPDFMDTDELIKNWKTIATNTPGADTRRLWRILNFAVWRQVFNL